MRISDNPFDAAARFFTDAAQQATTALDSATRDIAATAAAAAGSQVLRGVTTQMSALYTDALSFGQDLTTAARSGLQSAARQLLGPDVSATLRRLGAPASLAGPILDSLMRALPQIDPLAAAERMFGQVAQSAESAARGLIQQAGDLFNQATDAAAAICKFLFVPDPQNTKHDGQVMVITPDGWTGGDVNPNDPNAIHYVNGVNTSFDGAQSDAQALANQTGRPVVLTYNATDGFAWDAAQAGLDKFTFGLLSPNPATGPLADQMYQAAKSGHEVDFIPYSQGTIIARNALMLAHARLFTEKFAEVFGQTGNPLEAALKAGQFADSSMHNVHVAAAAPAAWFWPPYANVQFVTNTNDLLVANLLGQPAFTDPRELLHLLFGDLPGFAGVLENLLPTRDDLHLINETDGGINHSFQKIYMDDVAKLV